VPHHCGRVWSVQPTVSNDRIWKAMRLRSVHEPVRLLKLKRSVRLNFDVNRPPNIFPPGITQIISWIKVPAYCFMVTIGKDRPVVKPRVWIEPFNFHR